MRPVLSGSRRGIGVSDDRGVAAVEFAIMLPVLMLFVVGRLEFGFVMRDWLTVSGAVRDGARAATNGAANGCYQASGGSCQIPVLAQTAADAVEKAVIGMPKSAVKSIWVYKANASGFPGSATTQAAADAAGCTAALNCVAFKWYEATTTPATAAHFGYLSGGWNSSNINACLPNPEQIGVILRTEHPYMTRMFGATIALNDRAFMRFQPLPVASCNGTGPSSGGHG